MEAAPLSTVPSLPEDYNELFRQRIRSLRRRRLALIRDAISAQIDLLRFDLQELEQARQAEVLVSIPGPKVTANDANVHSRGALDLSSRSASLAEPLHPTLVRRVRDDATKLISLSDELNSTLAVVQGDRDVGAEFDVDQTLLDICGTASLAAEDGVGLNHGGVSTLILVTPPPEPLDALVNMALAVEPTLRSAASQRSNGAVRPLSQLSIAEPGDGIPEVNLVHDDIVGDHAGAQADPVESFFAEEFRVLRISENGEMSFQNRNVLASLRTWQLLRTQELNPLTSAPGHRPNYSEFDLGLSNNQSHDNCKGHSRTGMVDSLQPNRLASGALPIRLRSPFFQTRTYFLKNGYVPDELRVTEADWSGDLTNSELPTNPSQDISDELTIPEAAWVGDLMVSESPTNPEDIVNSTTPSLNPDLVSATGEESWQDSWQSAFASIDSSTRDVVHGYGYNGFRIDKPNNIKVISNFQTRTFLRLEPEAPDTEAPDGEAPIENGPGILTKPLDFLFRGNVTEGESNTDSNSSPPTMLVSDPHLADEASDVFNINQDGSLCIKPR